MIRARKYSLQTPPPQIGHLFNLLAERKNCTVKKLPSAGPMQLFKTQQRNGDSGLAHLVVISEPAKR